MSCEGCFTSAKGQQEEYLNVRAKAKEFGIENMTSVALWKEGYEFYYSSVKTAQENKKPIQEVLPFEG